MKKNDIDSKPKDKNNALLWAENEVRIYKETYCKNDDYTSACADSALRAYASLTEDGHSGFSWNLTKRILENLLDGRPLGEIGDDDFVLIYESDEEKEYQHPRRSALFKTVHADGTVTYHDNDRQVCKLLGKESYFHCFADRIVDELFPIQFPYTPPKEQYVVVVDEFLYDKNNGDFDTIGVLYIMTPDEGDVDVHKYFKEGAVSFVEIDGGEYNNRYRNRVISK